ncbi:unnamed protein product, partial [marine sediment metagenome]
SEDSKGIKEAQDELIAAGGGRNVVAGLIAIIDEKENRVRKPASVYAAMTVLGEMRAIEAVDVLVGHIGFPHVYEGEPMPIFGGMGMMHDGLKGIERAYPAVRPLIQIGEPCIGEVLRKLSRSDQRGERMACLGVLLGLRDQPLVVEMLKEAIENESDSIKRDRLQRGLNRLVRDIDY